MICNLGQKLQRTLCDSDVCASFFFGARGAVCKPDGFSSTKNALSSKMTLGSVAEVKNRTVLRLGFAHVDFPKFVRSRATTLLYIFGII
jgi:hypothetical protein